MAAETDHLLDFTMPFQLTKKVYRSVYPYISVENPINSQEGKIIVITGGGTGIGAAAARVWVRAGAHGVVIAGRRKEVLEKTGEELRKIGSSTILTVQTDLTVAAQVDNLFEQVNKTFGRPADVVLANAGITPKPKLLAEEDVGAWWSYVGILLQGLHHTVVSFIKSQPDPSNPVGTIINVSSGLAGLRVPGYSAYNISKLAGHAYTEFVHREYSKLRTFTLLPGIVATDIVTDDFKAYAKDEAELTGSLALYLAQPKADYLRGSLTSVNWDVEDMEKHDHEIVQKKLLQIKWVPVLPCGGGEGI